VTQKTHSQREKVLILSASAGTGHLRAASALQKVFEKDARVKSVLNVDALSYTNKLFRDFYSKFYIKLVQDAPTFLGWWYETSDEPWKTDKMRLMLDRMNTGPLVKLIKDFRPTQTICTHFLPAEIISHLMEKKVVQTQLSVVVTDFDFHAMWLSKVFHHYFVALEETRVHLTMLGLPPERITVSGIPVDMAFAERKKMPEARAKLGLSPDKPVILVSAGALGVGPAEKMVRMLQALKTPSQIVVVCGRSEALEQNVLRQVSDSLAFHLDFKVIGFTDQMHDWMAAADLFIGKPGGLTMAEALASELPFVVVAPIPGQEERNSDHLLEKGAGIRCNELTTLPFKVDSLLGDHARLRQMRLSARRMARPYAAVTVLKTLLRRPSTLPVNVDEESQEEMAAIARKR